MTRRASTTSAGSGASRTTSCPTRTTSRSCSARTAPSGSPPRSDARPHLIDGREAALEAAPRRAQVEPPHAQALVAHHTARLVEPVVEPPCPVAQCLRVVGREALDVVDRPAGLLERG